MHTVYAINDPRTGQPVYVGQTTNFETCQKGHLRLRKRGRPNYRTTNIKTWLYDLLVEGGRPTFVTLETCTDEAAALLAVTRWVETLAAEGAPLLNRWAEHRTIVKRYDR